MWMALSLLISTVAYADDPADDAPPADACDVPALATALKEATPVNTAGAWNDLASCDERKGKATAKAAFTKMIAGDDALLAAVTAVDLGLGDLVVDFTSRIEASDRSKTISALGEACSTVSSMSPWLITTPDALGERFWKERWYRAFTDCRTPEVQAWLANAISPEARQAGGSDTTYHDLLQAYARNAGAEAVPTLAQLARSLDDADELAVVNAFGDAANLGSTDGPDEAARDAAVAALVELAPDLSGRSIGRARGVLQALDASDEASSLAKYRWPERYTGERYGYGVAVTQTLSCKKGTEMVLHLAQMTEGGDAWPDQLPAQVEGKVPGLWELEKRAKKCKGTSSISVVVSPEPWGEPEAWEAFKKLHTTNFEANSSEASKATVQEQPSFRL